MSFPIQKRPLVASLFYAALLTAMVATLPAVHGQSSPEDAGFALDASPSTLVSTVKPGVPTQVELKLRNAGRTPERLKIETRAIDIADDTKKVSLSNETPADLASWVSYSHPTFTIKPNEWFTQRVTVTLPDAAGFSYPFAVVISRVEDPTAATGGRFIQGSLAVFTLINVDKPGATRKLEVEGLTTSQKVYEYLPADVTLTLRNTGNSIVQPYGNIFFQRDPNDQTPDETTALNAERGYILPGTTRSFTASWIEGFPHYVKESHNGKEQKNLIWNWNNVSQLRIGRYTAKVVAVYNDGYRDVPLIKDISFWVIPWRILAGLFIVIALLLFGAWTTLRGIFRGVKRISPRRR